MLTNRRDQGAERSTDGKLVYAIGDIHGRLDLLDRLLGQIAKDVAESKPDERPILVFLGDYVDRGPDSRGVIGRLLALRRADALEVRTLKGNHEQALLQFLEDAAKGSEWVSYGGAATLGAYGVQPPPIDADEETWADVQMKFASQFPADHLDFLRALELSVTYGDYIFVHAGVRPGVALADQRETDLLWIRDDFLSAPGPFEKIVVHGHSPREEAFMGPHRLGIDTGACMTGVLTAARLRDNDQTLLQTRSTGRSEAAEDGAPQPGRNMLVRPLDFLGKAAPPRPATDERKPSAASNIGDLLRPEVARSALLVGLLALSFAVLIYSFAVN
ncbi:MAG: metallophosphoesterase family protein [Caulobacteraceae bacterium]